MRQCAICSSIHQIIGVTRQGSSYCVHVHVYVLAIFILSLSQWLSTCAYTSHSYTHSLHFVILIMCCEAQRYFLSDDLSLANVSSAECVCPDMLVLHCLAVSADHSYRRPPISLQAATCTHGIERSPLPSGFTLTWTSGRPRVCRAPGRRQLAMAIGQRTVLVGWWATLRI